MKTLVVTFIIGILLLSCENIFQENPCNGIATQPLELNDTLRLKVGVYYCNKWDGKLLICDSVTNDSRCPVGVACFWEGNAEVSFELKESEEQKIEFYLNTNNALRTDTIFDGFKYQLIDLKPYPIEGFSVKDEEYTVLLAVSKYKH